MQVKKTIATNFLNNLLFEIHQEMREDKWQITNSLDMLGTVYICIEFLRN